MKVFVSHAVADKEIVLPFAELLTRTIGVKDDDLFCSSLAGSIRNGEEFVKKILTRLDSAELTIAILSQRYLQSKFCLAELGAAIVKRLAGSAGFFSLIIPPTTFGDLEGVLTGIQSGKITEDAALNELRGRLAPRIAGGAADDEWSKAKQHFLTQVAPLVDRLDATELLKKLTVFDVCHEPSDQENIQFKSKLRVLLKNNTGHEVTVRQSEWAPGENGVSEQNPPPGSAVFQVEGPNGWKNNDWTPATPTTFVMVRPGHVCRLWIGLNRSFGPADIRRLHESRQLGKLRVQVKIKGHQLPWDQQL
jgi:hypothetical protein